MLRKSFYTFLSLLILFVVMSPAYAWADRYYGLITHNDKPNQLNDNWSESRSLFDHDSYLSRLAQIRERRIVNIKNRNFLPENNDHDEEISSDGEVETVVVTKDITETMKDSQKTEEPASDNNDRVSFEKVKNLVIETKNVTKKVVPEASEISLGTIEDSGQNKSDNNLSYSVLEKKAFDLVNSYRVKQGLSSLLWDDKIAEVARGHSANMAKGMVPFSHDGFNERIIAVGKFMSFASIAENVAYNYGYDDPVKKAFDGWIDSPGHLKNIKGDYLKSGMGVVKSPEGKIYFTQLFVK